jgi:hypothetical protein
MLIVFAGYEFAVSRVISVFASVALTYLLFYTIYETGYAINDVVSVELETHPTIRASRIDLRRFILSRFAWFLGLLALFVWFGLSEERLLLAGGALAAIVAFHDLLAVRYSSVRVLSFALMRVMRYVFVVVVLMPDQVITTFIIMLPYLVWVTLSYTQKKLIGSSDAKAASASPLWVIMIACLPIWLIAIRASQRIIVLPNLVVLMIEVGRRISKRINSRISFDLR